MASKTKPSTTTKETITPLYMDMIPGAIAGLREAKGSTKPTIMKYIFGNYGIQNNSSAKRSLDNALKAHVKNRSIKQIKAAGSCVLYKLDKILEPSAAIGKTSKTKANKVVKSVRVSDPSSSKKTTVAKAKKGTTGKRTKAQNASKRKQETALHSAKQERPRTRSGRKPNTSQARTKVSQEIKFEKKTKQPITDDEVTVRKATEVVKPFDRAEELDIACGSVRSSQLPDIKITRKVPLGIRVFDDECDCQVRGLCSTPDGRIIVADCNNKKIKLFDQNGVYLAAHIFPLLYSYHMHICVVDNAEVIAHVLEETGARLYILDIKDNLFSVKENNPMWNGGFLLSISSCLDKIVKTGSTFVGNAVTLTDRRGEDYWSKSKSTDGQYLFGLPQFSACYLENNKPVIVISDSIKNTIFKLDGETGEIVKSISHDAPPFDVAVDADRGILYVCKCHIRQVCVYTTDLAIDNQRILLTHVDGLCDMPRYTTFNPFNRTLLISSESLAGGNYLECYQIHYE